MNREYLFGSETLDAIYDKWSKSQNDETSDFYLRRSYLKSSYKRVDRNAARNQRFEQWLWGNGFSVVQRNKKRYLKFVGDKKRLTFFLLKYGAVENLK